MAPKIHKYPSFVISKIRDTDKDESKRYWLNIVIDETKTESITVILKNPSKATEEHSDHTVNRVINYIHNNRETIEELKNIGTITILNLIPLYETVSSKLKAMNLPIYDEKNVEVIREHCEKSDKLIIAWGNHPKRLSKEYKVLRGEVLEIIKQSNSKVFYVQSLSKAGNPRHGQVWAYYDQLKKYE